MFVVTSALYEFEGPLMVFRCSELSEVSVEPFFPLQYPRVNFPGFQRVMEFTRLYCAVDR